MPVNAVLTALQEEVRLPVSVFGPVENWALARLAANWASEAALAGVGVGLGAAAALEIWVLLLWLLAGRMAARRSLRFIWMMFLSFCSFGQIKRPAAEGKLWRT